MEKRTPFLLVIFLACFWKDKQMYAFPLKLLWCVVAAPCASQRKHLLGERHIAARETRELGQCEPELSVFQLETQQLLFRLSIGRGSGAGPCSLFYRAPASVMLLWISSGCISPGHGAHYAVLFFPGALRLDIMQLLYECWH